MEAGLKTVTKAQPILNSTSAEPERLERIPPLAKKYNSRLIALTMGKSGIPVSADERVGIALESLIPRCLELDFPIDDLIIDPLVLTVSGCQQYCPELIGAVQTLPYAWDPAPGHLGRPVQCLERGAQENRAYHQPHLLRHAHGRGSADDDRRPAGCRIDGNHSRHRRAG